MSNKLIAVTSFGPAGWKDYAQRGLESLCKHWPGIIHAYHEDEIPDFEHPKVKWINLWEDEELVAVLHWMEANPILKGELRGDKYNYNFNAYKFCRKAFALARTCLESRGIVYWVDADARFYRDLPESFARKMLEDVYCGVLARKGYHIESGLVGIDCSHPVNHRFMERYRNFYVRGDFLYLKGFHDCWVFIATQQEMKAPIRNWSPEGTVNNDAIILSPWKDFLVHRKGKRKYEAVA